MELVIIEKDIKITPVEKKCCHCNEKKNKLNYIFVRDTYYCDECFAIIEHIDSVFDKKFKEYDKKLEDFFGSLKEKNSKLLYFERKLSEIDTCFKKILEEIDKANDEIKQE